jgi:hypothetical protein
VFFAAVAGTTEGLQVADIVTAAAGQGNNVIDRGRRGTCRSNQRVPPKKVI